MKSVKVKVVLVSKHYTMQTENKPNAFYTVTKDGNEWSITCSGCFTPKKRAPNNTHWISDSLDTRAGMEVIVKRKIPSYDDNNGLSLDLMSYS
jgi:hypothetical protein